jgi:hypothetical protein
MNELTIEEPISILISITMTIEVTVMLLTDRKTDRGKAPVSWVLKY